MYSNTTDDSSTTPWLLKMLYNAIQDFPCKYFFVLESPVVQEYWIL